MKRLLKSLTVLLVAALGAWGCAQGPANAPKAANDPDRIHKLEAQCARLEEDYRRASNAEKNASDKLKALEDDRARLTSLEAELRKEIEDVRASSKQSEEQLRQELDQRGKEIRQYQANCDKLKTTLRAALQEAESMTTPNATPTSSGGDHAGSGS
jgi:chromosome segregation ATPase